MIRKDDDEKKGKPDFLIQIPGLAQLLAIDKSGNNNDKWKIDDNNDNLDSSGHSNSALTQPRLYLLVGPSGSGKTTYCLEFLTEALQNNYSCIVISGAMTDRQYKAMFPPFLERRVLERTHFLNPFFEIQFDTNKKKDSSSTIYSDVPSSYAGRLQMTLNKVHHMLLEAASTSKSSIESSNTMVKSQSQTAKDDDNEASINHDNNRALCRTCVVVDSLTEFFILCNEVDVLKFVAQLCLLLKQFEVNAIFTLASLPTSTLSSETTTTTATASWTSAAAAAEATPSLAPSLSSLPSILSPFFDAILEMKLDQNKGREDGARKKSEAESLTRSIRLLSIKGLLGHNSKWVKFEVTKDGKLVFGEIQSTFLNCTMCGKPIHGTPIMNSEFPFDSTSCAETYRRLVGIYGSGISQVGGLPSQVVNMNFFFVDIVGLSNPALSVSRQIEKIEVLNSLIRSCDAFTKTKEVTIVLPTGDGMAIGFYTNPESPLKLSIELHKKIHEYNNSYRGTGYGKSKEAMHNTSLSSSLSRPGLSINEDGKRGLGIRIGLSSGPVFIVNDIKGNQNVWGPGIILARRVMDIGDNMHILISENMAGSLIALRDEYREIIKPLGNYSIKHGQVIKIYSAFSHEFGNPSPPAKMLM